ncbi:aspartate aminotransferase family protein [Candidatus Contendibacter odensensis]|uniref:Acetylornithine aminotransferase n=1 Tax=Candidatus Contendobacter odensis Run_B_J11 TaxID=1400861 RepID=A0A7U7GD93_9GAMM|nr:aspartate aminotransferase family protein [Candidatus Contendobacter odensis]CDH46271.1 bifunctional acetylornithine aminotransferase and succinyldiaminopimelate aminotransferase [Candidatus Contendobacter odensis Run_B_J11]
MNQLSVTRQLFDDVMVPNYAPAAIIPVRGEGSRLWDQDGRDYIDFAGGIAVTGLGHAHPRLVAALNEQAKKLWHVSNVLTNEPALNLARRLCELTFAERVFFANSGAEANEAALKLARKYSADYFGSDKREIIAFTPSFHGRTLFTVTVGGQPKYTEGFEPLPQGITHVPFNDLAAFAAAISERTCAVILEPVLGESGVISATPEFLQGVRELCDQHRALLIFDEVQCGNGRSGHLYAYMAYGVTPDILTTAKGLGGGFPISAMLTTAAIARSLSVGSHGTTYGGNPLGCAVAGAVLDIISDPELLAGVRHKHAVFMAGLHRINQRFGVFRELRGKGLLLGCELTEAWHGRSRDFIKAALDQRLLVLVAGPDVIRLAPSLIIPDDVIEDGLQRFEQAIAHLVSQTTQ